MYVTLDNETFEIPKMTKAFVANALYRYRALCLARNLSVDELKLRKETRDALEAELKLRNRRNFKPLID